MASLYPMRLTNGEAALAMLAKMSVEQLQRGFARGRDELQMMDAEDPIGTDYENFSPFDFNDSNFQRSANAANKMLGRHRIAIETAMVDGFLELQRRGCPPDISGIRMEFHPDWKLP